MDSLKSWLIRIYPRAWRRRYGAEFQALLDELPLNLQIVWDILVGAFDAHWTTMTEQRQELQMYTIQVHRRTIRLIGIILFCYAASYGLVRGTGVLVHMAQNRYTSGSFHYIAPSYAPAKAAEDPLSLFYTPLRVVEGLAWPLLDKVTEG